jgi:hypothetical protein
MTFCERLSVGASLKAENRTSMAQNVRTNSFLDPGVLSALSHKFDDAQGAHGDYRQVGVAQSC